MSDCVFCRLVAETDPGRVVYADELVVAVRSPEPQARVHLLLVPRRHVRSVDELTEDDQGQWLRLLRVAQSLARREGIVRPLAV